MPYLSTTLVTAARVGVRTTEVLGHEKGQCFIAQEGLTDFGFAEEELSWKVPEDNSCVGDGRDVGVGERVGD